MKPPPACSRTGTSARPPVALISVPPTLPTNRMRHDDGASLPCNDPARCLRSDQYPTSHEHIHPLILARSKAVRKTLRSHKSIAKHRRPWLYRAFVKPHPRSPQPGLGTPSSNLGPPTPPPVPANAFEAPPEASSTVPRASRGEAKPEAPPLWNVTPVGIDVSPTVSHALLSHTNARSAHATGKAARRRTLPTTSIARRAPTNRHDPSKRREIPAPRAAGGPLRTIRPASPPSDSAWGAGRHGGVCDNETAGSDTPPSR